MGHTQIEQVLRTWINEANSSAVRQSEDSDSAAWVTAQFIRWWRDQVGECLDSAEYSAACVRDELNRTRNADRARELMVEVTQLQQSLSALRRQLGLIESDAEKPRPA